MNNKFISTYCLIFIVALSIFSHNSFSQSVCSDTEIKKLKDDYIEKTIQINLGRWVKFLSDSVNTDSISKKEQIIELTSKNIKILKIHSIPFSITKNFESPSIQANAFFIKYEGELHESKNEGEFFPSKVTLTYKWKKLPNNILFFIYLGRELKSPLQNYIYIP